MSSSEEDELLPATIGRYEIKALLGRGGMAIVYRAFDPYMKRPIAIKVLSKNRRYDDSLRSRFKRESRMVASLNHSAIVPVYDFGEENEQPFLVMRYMEGRSLRDCLGKEPMGLDKVALLLTQIAPALDSTHSHKIIHRDMKPSNILFDGENKAYLADFGLAKFAEGVYTTLTQNDGMVGTPAYMSPEQIRGQMHLDGRTDIYALGVILFEMLTGQLPFAADSRFPIALMHLSDPVPAVHTLNSTLPESISHIIMQAMAKDREDRFNAATELTTQFIEAANIEALPPVDFPTPPPFILQPESESSFSSTSNLATVKGDGEEESFPEWLQSWLSDYGIKQDIGRSHTRGTLEDRLRVGTVKTQGGLPLLIAIVSDGGSSKQHGHLAAELVITELFNKIEQSETAVPDEIPEMLRQALQQTNRTLFSVSKQPQVPLVMESMVALVAIHENRLFIAYVGNGRIYLIRNRRLHQLTQNSLLSPAPTTKSLEPTYVDGGSSAIGQQLELQVDLGLYLKDTKGETAARQNQGLLLETDDRLLLCSDGLIAQGGNGWRMQQRRMRRILTENSPTEAANILVQDALSQNVADNVTVVVLQAPGTVPHIPLYKKQWFQPSAIVLLFSMLLAVVLFAFTRQPSLENVISPATATHITQILDSLTTTAVAISDGSDATAVVPIVPPDDAPEPGFAVIFAAEVGAKFRSSGETVWKDARSGDLVAIGENAAVRSGNGRMGVVLSDGAELYLAPETELALPEVNEAGDQINPTRVSLANGRLLIHYQNAYSHDFELNVPTDAKVLLPSSNNVVGVIYNENSDVLQMDCFTGICRLRDSNKTQILLSTRRYGIVDSDGITTDSPARPTLYCDLAPTLIACPTPTPLPTQTLPPIVQTVIAATETAFAQTTTSTATPMQSSTPLPTATPSSTPLPTAIPSSTLLPTAIPSSTPLPTAIPSSTPLPTTLPPTRTQPPSLTPTARASSTPRPSNTPVPPTKPPAPTSTPIPATATDTPEPTPTETPVPSPTGIPFTASPFPTFTPTPDINT
ncbi:MAG: protein kinase [Chloroflexi bacterium]|nr:protein kinase [Chloroflexota bacterium]